MTVISFKRGACLHPSRGLAQLQELPRPTQPPPSRPQVRMVQLETPPRQSLATGDSAASHRAQGRGRRETSAPTMLEHTRCSGVLCVRLWEGEIISGNGRDLSFHKSLGAGAKVLGPSWGSSGLEGIFEWPLSRIKWLFHFHSRQCPGRVFEPDEESAR